MAQLTLFLTAHLTSTLLMVIKPLDTSQGYSQIISFKVANVDKIIALYGHHTEITSVRIYEREYSVQVLL
jgi:hypothetical protein